ncbi:hypothetical protein, partial [Promicromonospora sukumoe]|uniref:hypothetical protein n=1 Tax=Promicromonospora sukumoe TaxID=88382 RepID=UPI0031DA92EB
MRFKIPVTPRALLGQVRGGLPSGWTRSSSAPAVPCHASVTWTDSAARNGSEVTASSASVLAW